MSEDVQALSTKGAASTRLLLIAAIFIIASCGLIYELLAGTLSSYLLGDSVTQFSLIIGLFLAAMGLGSWLTKFVHDILLAWFVFIECSIGLAGGLLALLGFMAFATTEYYDVVLISLTLIIGSGIGMEIPIVIRLLRSMDALPITLARVLSADYIGALAASVIFPFLLIPYCGLVRAGLLTGIANILVAALVLWRLGSTMSSGRKLVSIYVTASLLCLLCILPMSQHLVTWAEDQVYQDEVIYAEDTGVQRMVITRWKEDWRLYLNGHLQFSSIDEYRYHESLVHVAVAQARRCKRALILGGGDGMAARELLQYQEIEEIRIVDLDKRVTEIFTDNPALRALNANALHDERVQVVNMDAMKYLEQSQETFDVVLIDLPDPSDPSLGKLYSRSFYRLVARHVNAEGAIAMQATSPFRSRHAFWCIQRTLDAAMREVHGQQAKVRPYHCVVPSFGTWGFMLASPWMDDAALTLKHQGSFLRQENLDALFVFSADMTSIGEGISTLDNPLVVNYYMADYHRYFN